MRHRTVRFTESFFARLDEQLPDDRPADGRPSVTDFLVFDVPTIRDRLAQDAESCTMSIPPGQTVRAYIGAGTLVARFVVYVIIRPDEAVDVVDVEIDT